MERFVKTTGIINDEIPTHRRGTSSVLSFHRRVERLDRNRPTAATSTHQEILHLAFCGSDRIYHDSLIIVFERSNHGPFDESNDDDCHRRRREQLMSVLVERLTCTGSTGLSLVYLMEVAMDMDVNDAQLGPC
jgi:hypothetical protein